MDAVKQEIARVNIDILGISELKWIGMVNLIQMAIIFTAMDKNPVEKNGITSHPTKESQKYLGVLGS